LLLTAQSSPKHSHWHSRSERGIYAGLGGQGSRATEKIWLGCRDHRLQGGTQLVQALVGGSLDFAVMGGAYLTGAVRGADLVMVATHIDKFPLFADRQASDQRAKTSGERGWRSAASAPATMRV
jgi:hypothetical protein